MKEIYLSIKDEKAEYFNPPFKARNIADGMRTTANLVNANDNNMVAQSPSDFSLHQIASWNDDTGELVPTSKDLGSLLQFVKQDQTPS